MIEYILAVIILAVVILLVSSAKSPRNRGPRIRDDSIDYHGVYSHGPKSPDAEVHFPVRKDSTSVFPMNKRKERKKTETHQPRR